MEAAKFKLRSNTSCPQHSHANGDWLNVTIEISGMCPVLGDFHYQLPTSLLIFIRECCNNSIDPHKLESISFPEFFISHYSFATGYWMHLNDRLWIDGSWFDPSEGHGMFRWEIFDSLIFGWEIRTGGSIKPLQLTTHNLSFFLRNFFIKTKTMKKNPHFLQ